MSRRLALLAAVAVLACGCGTTVSMPTAPVSAPAAVNGLSVPSEPAAPGAPGTTNGVAPDAPGQVAAGTAMGAPGDRSAATGAPGTPTGAVPTGAAAPLVGRGFDAQHILLGYTTSHDANRTLMGLGFNVGVGDTDAQVKAIVADINEHGGILGRHVDLYAHDFSLANYSENPDPESQKACVDFTEDHKVFAVLNTIGLGNQVMTDCLAKHDVPLVGDVASIDRDPVYTKWARILYKPSAMNVDTYVPLFIKGLVSQHYFAGWNTATGTSGSAPVKLGIMHFDDPYWNYYIARMKKELAAAGYQVADEVTYSHNLDDVFAVSSNAVVQFRQKGITHVLNANIAFVEAAENQHYRPRYSIDEEVGPAGMALLAPKGSLHGSLGVGYNVYNDVPPASDPQDTHKPIQLRCKQVMEKGGQSTSDATILQAMELECDLFNFMTRSLNAADAISTDAVAVGANSLGTTFDSTLTFGVRFDATHHSGAVAARNFAYVDSCSCYHYTSPPFRAG